MKAAFLCLSFLLATAIVAGGSAETAFAASYDAEDVMITQDGMTYTCDFMSDGTASIKKPAAADGVTVMNMPSTLKNDDKTYTVTKLELSYGTKGNDVEQLTLPHTLTKISGWYFSKFSKVKELSIPGSIKKFETSLQNADALEKLTFEEGVEEIASNSMVFGCNNLKEISLPSSLKLISQSGTFSGASALQSINLPEDVEFGKLAVGMFDGCSSLTGITLPKSLTSIPNGYFRDCSSLVSVTAKGKITSIEDSAFAGCTSLPGVSFTGTLTSIGNSAFEGCEGLTSIPDLSHVTKMGTSAFEGCKYLFADVDLSSLDTIPDYAFRYSQVSVTKLSDTLTSIGNQAFVWGNLKTDLPDTLTTIGSYAFYGGSLPKTFVIPNSVTSVGASAFAYTEGTEEVTIGSGLTSIKTGLFDKCSIKKITIDNSKDDVSGTENLPSEGVEIVYLRESIDDAAGETISNKVGAKTLQEAVDEAPNEVETSITIEKHVKLSSTLNVPAGKKIKIVSSDPYTILAKTGTAGSLVNVADGASLEVAGNVTLRGRYNAGSIIDAKGKVVLSKGATILDGKACTASSGVVNVTGATASLTLDGGTIENCEIDDVYCGTVRAANGAKVTIRSGSIRNNRVALSVTGGNGNHNSSAGIMLTNGASMKMSGGEIANNNGYQGTAVMLYEPDQGESKRVSFFLTGGTIQDNKSSKLGSRTPSGAVHVEGNAELTMTGGEICNNSVASDGKGGGVCVVDPGVQGNGAEMATAFTMKAADDSTPKTAQAGGVIRGNKAYAGGGVYSYSNNVKLGAGAIKDNTATSMGGGVYSEGNDDHYSILHVENARIVENSANEQGGGLWFCPTGDAKIYVQDGGLIARSTADKAGDDVVFTGFEGDAHTLTLANRATGGGKVLWYKDGELFAPIGMFASVNPDVPRFVEDGDNGDPLSFTDATPNVALKSVMTDGAFELGAAQATLLIAGNHAARGGGIGANGGVVIGKDERLSIPVKKVWTDAGTTHPNKVTINLKNGDTVIDSLVLSAENNWSSSFYDLPKCDLDGSEIAYTVEEEPVDGFQSEVTGSIAGGFTVTNTKAADLDTPAPDNPTPEKPVKPSKPSKSDSSDKLAKTGDASVMPVIVLIVAASAAFAGAFIAHRKASSMER